MNRYNGIMLPNSFLCRILGNGEFMELTYKQWDDTTTEKAEY